MLNRFSLWSGRRLQNNTKHDPWLKRILKQKERLTKTKSSIPAGRKPIM